MPAICLSQVSPRCQKERNMEQKDKNCRMIWGGKYFPMNPKVKVCHPVYLQPDSQCTKGESTPPSWERKNATKVVHSCSQEVVTTLKVVKPLNVGLQDCGSLPPRPLSILSNLLPKPFLNVADQLHDLVQNPCCHKVFPFATDVCQESCREMEV
jgi:hypothetical protein